MAPTGAAKELVKKDIQLGGIFWLRNDAATRDEDAFGKSGLDHSALGHPVEVVETLGWAHNFVWICVVSIPIVISSLKARLTIADSRYISAMAWRYTGRRPRRYSEFISKM